MPPAEPAASLEPVGLPTLWLSLRLGRENWLFEFAPDEERAIVVGSLLRAHVRIDRPDIAPVHFHFEREHNRIRLCPAYGADLSVGAAPISKHHDLEGHALIRFAGLELEAYVCDVEPNILEQLDLRDWTNDPHPDCGSVYSLADAAEPTRSVQRLSVTPAPAPASDKTRPFVPLCDTYLQSEAPPKASPIQATPIIGVGNAELDCEPTLPGVRTAVSNPGDPIPSTALASADSEHFELPMNSLFGRIGAATRERPLLVGLGALCGAALLALALLAGDALLMRSANRLPESEQAPRRLHVAAAVPVNAPPDGEAIAATKPSVTLAEPESTTESKTRAVSRPALRGKRASKETEPSRAGAPSASSSGSLLDPAIDSGI